MDIQLPPIIVRSPKIELVKEALSNLFGVDCVKECSFEENNTAYIKFLPIQSNMCTTFYSKLKGTVEFTYKDYTYVAVSQYYSNI
jgi:hypothetical protein